jgi:TonB family protein
MRKFNLLFILLIVAQLVYSQKNSKNYFSVKGKVTDESGIGISAVSISIKGRGYGSMTVRDGSYSLKNVLEGDSIIFTHIAYKPSFCLVQGNNMINVEMKKNVYHYLDFKITDTTDNSKKLGAYEDESDRIFSKVEINASYKGGRKGVTEYFSKTIKYPEESKKRNIEGVVVIGFVVDKDNKVKDVKVVKGISTDCDETAVNAVKNMTDWVCAIQNGRMVEVYLEVSITFSLITLTAS